MADVHEVLSGAAEVWQRHGVAFAYLFGSEATGATNPLSDIDVAAHLGDDSDPASFLSVRLALIADLDDLIARSLANHRLDVVILNEAPVPLAYRVLRDGKLVFCSDEVARVRHWAWVVDRYIDMEPMRRTLAEGTRHRLEEGRFGRP